MYCDLDEFAAIVDVVVEKNSDIDLQGIIDSIWDLRNDGELAKFADGRVVIQGIGAAFGGGDLIVHVKTKVAPINGLHSTWRIAKFVEKVFNLPNVVRTNTRIVIHDPRHDERERAREESEKSR